MEVEVLSSDVEDVSQPDTGFQACAEPKLSYCQN